MWKAWSLLLFLLPVLLLASCGSGVGDQEDAPTVAPTTSEPTTIDPTTTNPTTTNPTTTDPTTTADPAPTSAATASGLPEGLVGTWSSSEGDATLAYRFSGDGGYRHVGLLTQPRATGTFEFSVFETGRVTVRGSRMTLQPHSGITRRKDPDDPGGNYERPISKSPRWFTWRLDTSGSTDRLYMKDAHGVEVSYDRE